MTAFPKPVRREKSARQMRAKRWMVVLGPPGGETGFVEHPRNPGSPGWVGSKREARQLAPAGGRVIDADLWSARTGKHVFEIMQPGSTLRGQSPKRVSIRKPDRPYLAWIHTQACCVTGVFGGPGVNIEANHVGPKPGLAIKCSDLLTIPMEQEIHRQWTDHTGRFKSWSRTTRREWADARIIEHLDRFASWVPWRVGELRSELATYAGGLTNDEAEIAADLGKQIEEFEICLERVGDIRAEVIARIREAA